MMCLPTSSFRSQLPVDLLGDAAAFFVVFVFAYACV